MKFANGLVFTLALTLLVTASPAPGQSDQPLQSPDEARAILNKVAKAYQKAPALTDSMRVKMKSGNREQNAAVTYNFDRNGVSMSVDQYRFVSVDGGFFAENVEVEDKYLKLDLDENFARTLLNITGGDRTIIPAPLFLRNASDGEIDPAVFAHGTLSAPKVVGVADVTRDKARLKKIVLESDSSMANVFVDPKTNLIQAVDVTLSSPQGPEEVNINFQYGPNVHKQLPEPVSFNRTGREVVSSMRELEPSPVSVGDAAPVFELQTLDGNTVALSDLKGQVVVLDFWATWCGPCKLGLPLLDKLHQWSASSEKPVRVFALNTLERTSDKQEIQDKVQQYWKSKDFSVPTLMDYDRAVAQRYGITSIPLTVIIGPDGKVEAVHSGFRRDMLDMLKRDVNRILDSQG